MLDKYFHLIPQDTNEKKKLLDIGSRPGNITCTLLPLFNGSIEKAIGIDVSAEMVDFANASYGNGILSFEILDVQYNAPIKSWTIADTKMQNAENYNGIKNIILEFDSIKKSKNLFEKFLSHCIKALETKQMSLIDPIDIVNRYETQLKLFLVQLENSINNRYQVTLTVSKMISGEHKNENNLVNGLDPQLITSLKFTPITSVDVKRRLSAHIEILSNRQQKFNMENLEKRLMIK
ncbi:hypothetical protein FQA39_LY01649 [Lamprigera yunnana]|nr:hypothetical protein FQA39_LY01649 [Lamprigera yunnana]